MGALGSKLVPRGGVLSRRWGLRFYGVSLQFIISILLFAFAILAGRQAAEWIFEGELNMLLLAGAGLFVIVVAIVFLRSWRTGFYVFTVWLLFEDLIRKYLGNNMGIYFAKDVLVGLVYVSLFIAIRKGKAKTFRPPFLAFLILSVWLAVIGVFNPNSPSPLYGVLGLKVDFWYVPLMFVGYALVRDETELRKFLLLFMVLAIAIGGLGIVQAVVGPSFLNPPTLAPEIRELGSLEKVTPLTNQSFYLPCSVFVSSGRFAFYLILAVIAGLGAVAYFVLTRARGRKVALTGIGVLAVAILLSGSRTSFLYPVLSAFVLAALFLWGAPWRWGRGRTLVKAIRRSAVLAAVALALFAVIFPRASQSRISFYSQTLLPSSSAYELSFRSWNYPMQELTKSLAKPHWIVGNGTGTATLGIQYVAKMLKQPEPGITVEEGYGQLIVEMGILAPILWLLWTISLVWYCWKVARQLKATAYFPIAAAIVWYAFTLLFPLSYLAMDAYQNFVNNAFLWILVGILFRLPEIASAPAARGAIATVRI